MTQQPRSPCHTPAGHQKEGLVDSSFFSHCVHEFSKTKSSNSTAIDVHSKAVAETTLERKQAMHPVGDGSSSPSPFLGEDMEDVADEGEGVGILGGRYGIATMMSSSSSSGPAAEECLEEELQFDWDDGDFLSWEYEEDENESDVMPDSEPMAHLQRGFREIALSFHSAFKSRAHIAAWHEEAFLPQFHALLPPNSEDGLPPPHEWSLYEAMYKLDPCLTLSEQRRFLTNVMKVAAMPKESTGRARILQDWSKPRADDPQAMAESYARILGQESFLKTEFSEADWPNLWERYRNDQIARPSNFSIDPVQFFRDHAQACTKCASYTHAPWNHILVALSSSTWPCYSKIILFVLIKGAHPLWKDNVPRLLHKSRAGRQHWHATAKESVRATLQQYEELGAIRQWRAGTKKDPVPRCVNPVVAVVRPGDLDALRANLRRSDRARAAMPAHLSAPLLAGRYDNLNIDDLNTWLSEHTAERELFVNAQDPVKVRTCVNPKHGPNKHSIAIPFSYSPLERFLRGVRRGHWLWKIDLAKAFFHLKMAQWCRALIAHFYSFEGPDGTIFIPVKMLWGMSEAPAIMSMVVGESLHHILPRCSSRNAGSMIDDIYMSNETFEGAVRDKAIVMEALTKQGWTLNADKSKDPPTQRLEITGITIDTLAGTISLSEVKLAGIKRKVVNVYMYQPLLVRHVQSLIGSLTQACRVCHVAKARMSSLYQSLPRGPAHHDNDAVAELSADAHTDLQWWTTALTPNEEGDYPLKWSSLWDRHGARPLRIFTDASGDEMIIDAGFAIVLPDYQVFRGVWDVEATQGKSSTWRELVPVEAAVKACIAGGLTKVTLLITTDSQPVFYMINGLRVRSEECRALFYSILEEAHTHDIDILADWIPREFNSLADAFTKWSKFHEDWKSIPLLPSVSPLTPGSASSPSSSGTPGSSASASYGSLAHKYYRLINAQLETPAWAGGP